MLNIRHAREVFRLLVGSGYAFFVIKIPLLSVLLLSTVRLFIYANIRFLFETADLVMGIFYRFFCLCQFFFVSLCANN